jgi:DNA-binding NtrC family response regulator
MRRTFALFPLEQDKTPLIVMSARRNVSILGESENWGAYAFVKKLFSPERFLDLVNLAVRQNSRYRQMTG